ERRPDRLDVLGAVGEGRLAGVEHRQQRLDEAPRGPLDLVGGLAVDPLAVVLEGGLEAERDVLGLVALGRPGGDVGGDRLGGDLLRHLDLVGGDTLAVGGGVGRHDCPSSSTISASTISSSAAPVAPLLLCPDADVPAALASRAAAS